ncbi:MAG: hypothetical protein HY217_05075, partial [Candidatus Rokubacteria bacterium]|nr:hypothetical protein [Candidatus Rokubacteria bacterium]
MRIWPLSIVVACALSCGSPAPREPRRDVALLAPQRPSAEMALLIEQYEADRGALERTYNLPFATRRQERMTAFYDGWEKKLAALDFAALPRDGRVDFILLRNHLRNERALLERRTKVDEAARPLVPFAALIAGLEEQRRAFEAVDAEGAAGRVVALAKQVREAKKSADTALDRPAAHRAADWVDRLRSTLKNWHNFYSGYDPLFTWWVEKPWKDADRELEGYASFLRDKSGERKEGAEGLVGAPIGSEGLKAELARELIPYGPEELIAIAEREFAWCEARMKEASRELGCG